jgi:hypothetical protein
MGKSKAQSRHQACADCGYPSAAYSLRFDRVLCGQHFFASIPEAEREESIRAWTRRDLAGQIRAAARQLGRDPRAERLKDLAFGIEFASDDAGALAPLREARAIGVKVTA